MKRKITTHCIHGHEYTVKNTYIWHGYRRCVTCNTQATIRRWHKNYVLKIKDKLPNNCICLICKISFRTKPSIIKNGGGKYCGKDCRKIGKSKSMLGKNIGSKFVGKDNPNWKGGLANENTIIRRSFEYKQWRKAVFERDNYTCVFCGHISIGDIEADHIKPFSLFPELRFDVDNGRTLCIPCHRGIPKPNQHLSTHYQWGEQKW